MLHVRKPFKLPNRPSYYIEVGKKRRSLRTTSYKEAMQKYIETCQQVLNAESYTPSQTKLKDFEKEYLAWAESVQAAKTFAANRLALENLMSSSGDILVSDVTTRHLDAMVAACKNRGLKVSSINNYIRHIRSIFNKASEWYSIENPFRTARQLPKEQQPPRYLSKNEAQKLLEELEGEMRLLCLAYLSTGRRRNELLELKWRDVDLGKGKYLVLKSKSRVSRFYPINKTFRSVLEELPRNREYVFSRLHPDTVSKRIKKALVAIGRDDMHLHDLRHSFASFFVMAGGNLRVLQDLLGHEHYSTTEIYAHIDGDMLLEESERVTFA
jgi:integrase